MSIIISKNGKDAKRISESEFKYEDNLQEYIFNNPESIPLYEISKDNSVLILSREFTVGSGSIDALGIDNNGDIYIIETKLYKNPDKRLVVAQLIDYGASLWRNSSDSYEFLQQLERESKANFNLDLNMKLTEFFNLENDEIDILVENIKMNLKDGNFKFVVLMNKISSHLKNMILFLNENSRFDFYGVELDFYKLDDLEITIPKIIGTETNKRVSSRSSKRKKWNKSSFFTDVNQKLDSDQSGLIKSFYNKIVTLANEISWGTGNYIGSFNPRIYKISQRSIFSVYSNGDLTFNFKGLDDTPLAYEFKKYLIAGIIKWENVSFPSNLSELYLGSKFQIGDQILKVF